MLQNLLYVSLQKQCQNLLSRDDTERVNAAGFSLVPKLLIGLMSAGLYGFSGHDQGHHAPASNLHVGLYMQGYLEKLMQRVKKVVITSLPFLQVKACMVSLKGFGRAKGTQHN